ncbi:MAG: hypothetical protein ACI86M_001115 [Saprospiraceae bacterium]|jgi:hypothetical protein
MMQNKLKRIKFVATSKMHYYNLIKKNRNEKFNLCSFHISIILINSGE